MVAMPARGKERRDASELAKWNPDDVGKVMMWVRRQGTTSITGSEGKSDSDGGLNDVVVLLAVL